MSDLLTKHEWRYIRKNPTSVMKTVRKRHTYGISSSGYVKRGNNKDEFPVFLAKPDETNKLVHKWINRNIYGQL